MCDCLDQLAYKMGWVFPFSKPISYNKEGGLKAGGWAVQLHKETKGGKPSKESMFLFLSYCPICGDPLREQRVCTNHGKRPATHTVMYDGLGGPRYLCEECKELIKNSDIEAYENAVIEAL